MGGDFLGKPLGNKTHRLWVDKNLPMDHLVTEFREEKAGLETLVIRVQADGGLPFCARIVIPFPILN